MPSLQYTRMKLQKKLFNLQCRKILDTPPIQCAKDSKVVILSQIYHPDLIMFMLAAKSFARFLPVGRFVIVDDGLTDRDRRHLEAHFDRISFVPTAEVRARQKVVPSGGTWERFMTIAGLNAENFVIQLDADTLTIAKPDEVLDAVDKGVSFALGTHTGREIVAASETARNAASFKSTHVQARAESVMDKADTFAAPKYVRGCSGFAGFAAGTLNADRIERFSARMSELLGADKWSEWGSEQITSNYFVANAPDARVLPVEAYPFWSPDCDARQARLIHFFGTYRFHAGAYARFGRRVIRELSQSAGRSPSVRDVRPRSASNESR